MRPLTEGLGASVNRQSVTSGNFSVTVRNFTCGYSHDISLSSASVAKRRIPHSRYGSITKRGLSAKSERKFK